MIYNRLGNSGLQVSALSFGSWLTFAKQIENDVAEKCMIKAYDAGINFFDNAEGYAGGASETVMGNILHKLKWDRTTYLVSSKVYFGGDKPNQSGLSRKHVMEACHAALLRLKVDYLDLFFCHRPDKNTPIEETVRAMHDLITQGKVLYWGTSEWSAQEIMEAHGIARAMHLTPPTMEQPQYNMFHRERFEVEYLKLFKDLGLGTTIWSPLASGMLTGKYLEGLPAEFTRAKFEGLEWLKEKLAGDKAKTQLLQTAALAEIAKQLDIPLPVLAIAWCLKNKFVSTAILGASRVEQLTENLKAIDAMPLLDEKVMERIESILDNKPKQPAF